MAESYQSVGPASPTFYLYLGALCVLAGVIGWFARRKVGTLSEFPVAMLAALCGIGIWICLCGWFELPRALINLAVATFMVIAIFVRRNDLRDRASRGLFIVLFPASALMFMFGAWFDADRKITLTNGALSESPSGIHRHSTATASLYGLHIDAAWSPADLMMSSEPWVDWHIWSGKTSSERSIYFNSDMWFWGPHGLIRADQLGRRIANWAGVAPTYHKED